MSEESARDIAPEVVPPVVEATPVAVDVPPPSTEPAKPTPYPFSVMRVIKTTWRVMKNNAFAFLVVACVLAIPSLLAAYTNALVSMICQQVTSSLATSFVCYGVIMELNGTRPSTHECIRRGLSSFWRVLGVSVFTSLAVIASLALFVIPGIIVSLMLFVIVPVTVTEKLGLDAAMKRSRELTAGRKGDLFALGLCLSPVFVAIALVAVQLEPWAQPVWFGASAAIAGAIFSVISSVVYVTLRQIREGTQVPEIATAIARIRS